jgi:indolepyruvate ferredoxin oxidoreductase, beta subunit
MKYDIIIAGVGGQGILSVAFVLDHACVTKGVHFKQAEVHGMSQRGGAVQSHLRMSEAPILSDLIPQGRADMILAVEPLEVNRYLPYLADGGLVLSNSDPVKNIPDYPALEAVHDHLLGLPGALMIDAKAVAKAAGNQRAQNMVLTGAASAFIPFFTPEEMQVPIHSLFGKKGDKILALNIHAFGMGREFGLLSKALLDLGVPSKTIYALSSKLQPETVKAEHASGWAEALGTTNAPDRLAALDTPIPSGPEGYPALLG